MDPTKWKSVVVPIDLYKGMRKVSDLENRNLYGLFRQMFEKYCESNGYNIQKKNR